MSDPVETYGAPITNMAPLLPTEVRLRYPFKTPGLEELRRGVLQAISGADQLDQRIRGVLLTANQNDFVPIFADILYIPREITREVIAKRRRLFNTMAELDRYPLAIRLSLQELRALGIADEYVTVIETRYRSPSPQYRLSAICALLLFAALSDSTTTTIVVDEGPPIFVIGTEGRAPLKTDAEEYLEV